MASSAEMPDGVYIKYSTNPTLSGNPCLHLMQLENVCTIFTPTPFVILACGLVYSFTVL